jgi:7-cyano-7-deazaguanine synthase in queuosine biosynthesis
MISPRLILCGGVAIPTDDPRREKRRVVTLSSHGPNRNVNIRMEDVAKVFQRHLSPRMKDLLEIAAYIYTADCATKRNGKWEDDEATEPWHRNLHFVIPVRDLAFWQREDVVDLLTRITRFISDDQCFFDFSAADPDEREQGYCQFGSDKDWPLYDLDRVVMFSGGLDSLAGAVQRASQKKGLVLVSHRPVAAQSKRQRELFKALRNTYSVPMIHVPVWLNKDGSKGKEHTQRTRSFLYATLGAIVAHSVKAKGLSFFENGIVSLNFPVADEALRARASRTTHPLALAYFSDFFRLVLDRQFTVDNPFIFKTKTEIVSLIAKNGGGHLIGLTCSCSHQMFVPKTQLHCGACSQCIDRRIAALGAGAAAQDPETDYRADVFTGARADGYDRNMGINYVRHGMELCRASHEQLAVQFNLEISRAIRPFPNPRAAAEKFIKMHERHGQIVSSVLKEQLKAHLDDVAECRLPESSLLAMFAGQQHKQSLWKLYADRIASLLADGLPRACTSEDPKNEPRLQELCDAILAGNGSLLIREYPLLRWGSVGTKPDWSAEEFGLWVEMKYVRTKKDILPISEAIAADITKYGDSGNRVLYAIYDPHHLIVDETTFSMHILRRENMMVRFVR